MKNLSIKKIIIGIIFVISIIFIMILLRFGKKNDGLKVAMDAIENIFFFLPETKYDNLNEIPDYCKISLVYGTKYLNDEKYISEDDYYTVVKKQDKKAVKAYNKDSILNAIKSILGDDANINFSADENDEYLFLVENGCGYNNKNINSLGYSEIGDYIYSYDNDEAIESNLYIKWEKPVIDGDIVNLSAKALLPIENQDGSYTVYTNGERFAVVGTVEKGKKLKDELRKMCDEVDVKYNFTLQKNGSNYIWIKYEVIDNLNSENNLIDDNYLIRQEK